LAVSSGSSGMTTLTTGEVMPMTHSQVKFVSKALSLNITQSDYHSV